MVTDADHIQNLRARLLQQKQQKEAEMREIDEALRVLGAVPGMLGAQQAPAKAEKREAPKRYNINLAGLVRDQVAASKNDEIINIGDMVKVLMEEHGVTGKKPSLYAYIHSLLKEMSAKGLLKHEKGKGFYKTRRTDKEEQENPLVASV